MNLVEFYKERHERYPGSLQEVGAEFGEFLSTWDDYSSRLLYFPMRWSARTNGHPERSPILAERIPVAGIRGFMDMAWGCHFVEEESFIERIKEIVSQAGPGQDHPIYTPEAIRQMESLLLSDENKDR